MAGRNKKVVEPIEPLRGMENVVETQEVEEADKLFGHRQLVTIITQGFTVTKLFGKE